MKYKCDICLWVYDEDKEGKKFDELDEYWVCPICGADKQYFEQID